MPRLYSLCFLLAPLGLLAQPNSEPSFLVASVKQATFRGLPETLQENGDTVACTCRLHVILQRAYGAGRAQMVMPGWFADQFYEINAKLPAGATKEQIPQMLRGLLSERFHLESHLESRPTDVYALRVDPGGLKAKPAPPGAPVNLLTSSMIFFRQALIHIDGNISLARLTQLLYGTMDRLVFDQTGVEGYFQIALDARLRAIQPDFEVPKGLTTIDGQKVAGDAPMIFTEIRKLGLTLEPAKLPLDFVVVDRIDRIPTVN